MKKQMRFLKISKVLLLLLPLISTAGSLDINKMQEAAGKLKGKHDFRTFLATGSLIKSTERTIKEISITSKIILSQLMLLEMVF